jgi:hypothetical protein
MPKQISAARLMRATELRDAAVDLVAQYGKMVGVRFMDKTIETMAFENEHVAILYKTPRLKLDCPWAPASANPKGFLVDVFSASRKTFSVQWERDGQIEVLLYKPGVWESFLDAAPHPPAGFPA